MTLPDFGRLRAGLPGCPSDFALDRFHAGELTRAAGSEIESHASTCRVCAARLAERRAGFNAIEGVDPRRLLAGIRTRVAEPAPSRFAVWARRLLAPLAVFATVGAVLLVARPHERRPRPVPQARPENRAKGGSDAVLHVYRQDGDHSQAMLSGDRFTEGDRLRFAVDLPASGYVSIVGVEASGTLYDAWPLDGSPSTEFRPGQEIELPGAVALDGTTGRESLYLVVCPPSVGPPRCASAGAGERPVCQSDCTLIPFVMEKGR